jgi:hypothetical protein
MIDSTKGSDGSFNAGTSQERLVALCRVVREFEGYRDAGVRQRGAAED